MNRPQFSEIRSYRGEPLYWVHLDPVFYSWLCLLLAQPRVRVVHCIGNSDKFTVYRGPTLRGLFKQPLRRSAVPPLFAASMRDWLSAWIGSDIRYRQTYHLTFYSTGRFKLARHQPKTMPPVVLRQFQWR